MTLRFKVHRDIANKVRTNPDLRRLHTLWQVTGEGDLPLVDDVVPQARSWFDEDLMVLERQDAGFCYLHYGAAIARVAGVDMTGRLTSDSTCWPIWSWICASC